jgi:glycerol-3-phosphate dehydrogenase
MPDKEDFVPGIDKPIHFASLSTEAQIALAQKDPSYGRIVCRCEFISEGEILDAIRRGARTLDGIKFRTRAGMGRCQGGFCTGRCMELLSQKLDLPLTAITKRGGDSWVARPRHEEVSSC